MDGDLDGFINAYLTCARPRAIRGPRNQVKKADEHARFRPLCIEKAKSRTFRPPALVFPALLCYYYKDPDHTGKWYPNCGKERWKQKNEAEKIVVAAAGGGPGIFLAAPAAAEETTSEAAPYTVPDDMSGEIVILHTNDVHGAIAGYAKVAALKAAMEEAGAYVLLMDAGDFIQGDPTVSI